MVAVVEVDQVYGSRPLSLPSLVPGGTGGQGACGVERHVYLHGSEVSMTFSTLVRPYLRVGLHVV